jgi:predicted O-methyltransferase YrrM
MCSCAWSRPRTCWSTTFAPACPPDSASVTTACTSGIQVARRSLDRAALAPAVDIRVGPAADSLRDLIRTANAPFDLIFLDANKSGYVEYLNLALELSRPGTLILADNVIRHGLVLDSHPADPNDAGAKAYNDAIARRPRLESLILPIGRARVDGLSISLVR